MREAQEIELAYQLLEGYWIGALSPAEIAPANSINLGETLVDDERCDDISEWAWGVALDRLRAYVRELQA